MALENLLYFQNSLRINSIPSHLFDNSDQMNMIAEIENQIITLHVDEDHIPIGS